MSSLISGSTEGDEFDVDGDDLQPHGVLCTPVSEDLNKITNLEYTNNNN